MSALPPLFARRPAIRFLHQQGFPIGSSTFDKICAPSCDPILRERYKGGPPVAAYVPGPGRTGLRPMYEPAALLAWANSLLVKPESSNQAASVETAISTSPCDHDQNTFAPHLDKEDRRDEARRPAA
jgi:hypothetical protein